MMDPTVNEMLNWWRVNRHQLQRIGSGAETYAPQVYQQTKGIPFVNKSGEEMPPYACFFGQTVQNQRIEAYKPGTGPFSTDGDDGGCVVLFNGPNAIPANGTGNAQDSEYIIADVDKNPIGGPANSTIDMPVGPVPNSWQLRGFYSTYWNRLEDRFQHKPFIWMGNSNKEKEAGGYWDLVMRPTRTPRMASSNYAGGGSWETFPSTTLGNWASPLTQEYHLYRTINGDQFPKVYRSDGPHGYRRPLFDPTIYHVIASVTYRVTFTAIAGDVSATFQTQLQRNSDTIGYAVGSIACNPTNTTGYLNLTTSATWLPDLSFGTGQDHLYWSHQADASVSAGNISLLGIIAASIVIVGVGCDGRANYYAGALPGNGPGTGTGGGTIQSVAAGDIPQSEPEGPSPTQPPL